MRAEAKELVKRCEAVGWTVVISGRDHWKVDTKKGVFTFASTPSSYRSMKNAYAEANRYGLERLEIRLAELRAAERQVRLEEDRSANDARLARIIAVTGASRTEPDDAVDSDQHLGFVDGVRIVAVAPALIKTPIMPKPAPLRDGEELLLADGRICYRCTKLGTWRYDDVKKPTELCHAIFDAVNSLRNHIGYHSMTPEQITRVRSIPNRKNRQPSPAQHAALEKIAVAYNRESETETVSKPSTPAPAELNIGEVQALIITMVEDLSAAIFDVGGKLIDVRNAHIKVVELVRKIQPEVVEVRVEVPVTDPELAEKARKFDALKGLMQ